MPSLIRRDASEKLSMGLEAVGRSAELYESVRDAPSMDSYAIVCDVDETTTSTSTRSDSWKISLQCIHI
jgi:hypothetical protein